MSEMTPSPGRVKHDSDPGPSKVMTRTLAPPIAGLGSARRTCGGSEAAHLSVPLWLPAYATTTQHQVSGDAPRFRVEAVELQRRLGMSLGPCHGLRFGVNNILFKLLRLQRRALW